MTDSPAMAPAAFLDALLARGFDLFAGVPCSLLKGLLGALRDRPELGYLAAPREDQALGVAAGAALAGRSPVVLMQNSGLGVSLNALVSLQRMYRLPTLLLITWRGYGGQDAPEHVELGPKTPSLLESFEVPHRTLLPASEGGTPAAHEAALDWASATLAERSSPCALLVRKGAL